MNKEKCPPSVWRFHQKCLNPCGQGGASEELFHRQQQNNGSGKKEKVIEKTGAPFWLNPLKEIKK